MTSHSTPEVAEPDLLHLVWRSLGGEHKALAQHNAHARRYQPEIAPFGALDPQNGQSVEHLAELMNPGEQVCLIDQEADLPRLFDIVSQSAAVHMVYRLPACPAASDEGIRLLTPADLPDMEALIAAVFPGYFRRRTIEMGRYVGIVIEGQLAAMAGERLATSGLREISSICTHTAYQGRGLAARLTNFLVGDLLQKDRRPFLHVGFQNAKARRLYAKLGFQEIRVAALNLYRRN